MDDAYEWHPRDDFDDEPDDADDLMDEREILIRALAHEDGFQPCGDCFNGYCSMNCSSAPLYMKVMI